MWQDAVISTIVIILAAAMVPQVYHGFKFKQGPISHASSVPTFLGLFCLAGVYTTLDLWLSSLFAFLTGILWLILFWQRIHYTKK